MNTFGNPFNTFHPFGFFNGFNGMASPASFGGCGTGCFPGVNNVFNSPFNGFNTPSFQNPWSSPIGQWINTTSGSPSFGFANAPTGWTNTNPTRFNGWTPTNTNWTTPNTFNGWSTPSTLNGWTTPFSWINGGLFTNTFINPFNTTPGMTPGITPGLTPGFNSGFNPGFPGATSPFAGWTNAFNPLFSSVYGSFPWNGTFNTPFGVTGWNNAWNVNPFFNTTTAWNTIPTFTNTFGTTPFFGVNPFGFFQNTPWFNPTFNTGMNPNVYGVQNIPTNSPFYTGTPTGQNTGGNPFQTGVTNQPNTNPGLCRDAA